MTRARINRTKIKSAIPDSGGIVAIVARKAGYSWGAVRDFIREDPELSRLMQDEAERVNDAAENTIIAKIMDGDDAAARWWLARTRRAKFGENVSVNLSGKVEIIPYDYNAAIRTITDGDE